LISKFREAINKASIKLKGEIPGPRVSDSSMSHLFVQEIQNPSVYNIRQTKKAL